MDWWVWIGIGFCVWCVVAVPTAFALASIMAPRDDD